jgi:hypothetical protein
LLAVVDQTSAMLVPVSVHRQIVNSTSTKGVSRWFMNKPSSPTRPPRHSLRMLANSRECCLHWTLNVPDSGDLAARAVFEKRITSATPRTTTICMPHCRLCAHDLRERGARASASSMTEGLTCPSLRHSDMRLGTCWGISGRANRASRGRCGMGSASVCGLTRRESILSRSVVPGRGSADATLVDGILDARHPHGAASGSDETTQTTQIPSRQK